MHTKTSLDKINFFKYFTKFADEFVPIYFDLRSLIKTNSSQILVHLIPFNPKSAYILPIGRQDCKIFFLSMTNNTILVELLNNGTISQVLHQSDSPKDEVQQFKKLLYQLGFEKVINGTTQKIDGIYDAATVATVKEFCQKNNISSDGKRVTMQMARTMQDRYELLQPMLELHDHLQNDRIGDIYYKGSPHTEAIKGLQKLLKAATGSTTDIGANSGEFDETTINAINSLMTPDQTNAPNSEESSESTTPTTTSTATAEDSDIKHKLLHVCGNILGHFGLHTDIGQLLQAGKGPHPYIGEVQNALHHLGFGKELGQSIKKLDGVFGPGVESAVKAFAHKNGIPSDGKQITGSLAKTMQKRLDALPFMHQLQRDLREGKVEEKYFKGSTAKTSIGALQYVLKDLGLGKKLDWDQKANDGNFDDSVVKALKTHFKKGYFHDLSSVSPNMVFSLLKDVGKNYGSDWEHHVKSIGGDENSILTHFTASNFIGKPIIANIAFVPALQKINLYARKNDVKIYIVESFRPANAHLTGTIVKPASHSNHKVGHAIDMNIQYDGGQLANHNYMYKTNRANWADPVRGFLDDITADQFLRWGGNFTTEPDPVHIDDDFNHNYSEEEFNHQYQLVNQAYDNHDIGPA